MKNLKLSYIIGFLAITISAMVFYSCEENSSIENIDDRKIEEVDNMGMKSDVVIDAFTVSATITGGGGSSCDVSCFWGSCSTQCNSGQIANCYCSWGSPECICQGGNSVTSVQGYNPQKTADLIQFVVSNNFDPVVEQVINQLAQVIEQQNWEEYEFTRMEYIATLESIPPYQQNIFIEYIENE